MPGSGERPPVLIPEAAIRERVRALGEQITRDYQSLDLVSPDFTSPDLVVLGVLKGAFMFVADLVREIDLSVVVDFVSASSYGGERTSTGQVKLIPGTWTDVEGRDVLVVEDVIDTGRTLDAIIAAVREHQARSVRTVALLRKPRARARIDYVGFDIDDRFVVGYSLDDAGKWRHLSYIGFVTDMPS